MKRIWTIPSIPKTANSLRYRHWRIVHNETKRWRRLILAVCRSAPLLSIHKIGKVKLKVTVYRGRKQDKDNQYSSVKPILDALCQHEWLVDDNEKFLELEVAEVAIRGKANYKTVIEWESEGLDENMEGLRPPS